MDGGRVVIQKLPLRISAHGAGRACVERIVGCADIGGGTRET